jgi:hypothetical protein
MKFFQLKQLFRVQNSILKVCTETSLCLHGARTNKFHGSELPLSSLQLLSEFLFNEFKGQIMT